MDWRKLAVELGPLLVLALIGQFGLAIFEGTIALYAQAKFNYGPGQVGAIFVVCGLVMAVFQVGAASLLAGRIREIHQIGAGLGLMGISLGLIVTMREAFLIFAFVGLSALGMSLVAPNLAALISKGGGSRRTGVALGAQNAANSLGQASGPLLGGLLQIALYRASWSATCAMVAAFPFTVVARSNDESSR